MRAVRGTNWNAKDSEKLRKKALEICESARGQLVLRHPFVGRLGVHIPFLPVMDSRVRTIATNGKVIYVRPEWLCRMPPVTMVAIIAHTIWTAALCHSFRRGEVDPVIFDAASDLEVYSLLRVEKVPMCMKPDFADQFPVHVPVEEIAAKLTHGCERHPDSDVHLYTAGIISLPPIPHEEEKKQEDEEKSAQKDQPQTIQFQDGDGSQDGQSSQNGQGNSQDGQSSQNGQGNSQNGQGNSQDRRNPQNDPGDPQGKEIDDAVETSCDPAMKEVWRQRIIEAGQHYKMVFGDLPGELAELVQSFQESRIDYLQLLRKYLSMVSGGEAHWLPPARRFVWQGMYLPSHSNPKIEVVVAVDTSGSIDEEQFRTIFSEIAGIVKGLHRYELTLIQCDSKIHSIQKFSASNPFNEREPLKIKGGGGTDFQPVFRYIKKNKLDPKVLLFYTDGDGSFPEKTPRYPVIWLLQNDSAKTIPWGKVIKIPKRERN